MSLGRSNKSTWGNDKDSEMMRSLEKVAHQKGLVKKEDLVKTATIKEATDLTPSASFTLNIIKLCSGLREQGFDKYADELETKFSDYKLAQTLYETSKETGEDLVDRAHPKGSHHLEDVDSDESVIETILDQQLKDLKIVNKEPSGKLSSQDIINSVKTVLGDSFLENGRANSSRKIAQETSGSDIAKDVGIGVASTIALNKAVSIIKNWREGGNVREYNAALKELQKATTRFNAADQKVLMQAMKNPAVAQRISQVAPDVAKSLSSEIAKDVGGAAAKSVSTEVAKDVSTEVAKDVGGAATRSTGLWGRILPWLSRAGTLAGELGATEIGGGVAGAAGATAAAALIGGIVAGSATWALFSKYQEPTDIKDAGDYLIERADSSADDLPVEGKRAIANFKVAYNKVLENYSVIKDLQENKNPSDLLKLQQLQIALNESNKQAQKIWSYAQSELDKEWYNPRGILGGGLSGLVTKSNNYMTRSRNLGDLIDRLLVDIIHGIDEAKTQKNNATKGGNEGQQLLESYNNTAKEAQRYMDQIHAKRPVNELQIATWLRDMIKFVHDEAFDFNKNIAPENKKDAVGAYLNRLNNEVKPRLEAFKAKAIERGWM